MSEEKKPLNSLFRDNPETPEGKYLVCRRDGTTVEWPSFVLGARDENATNALRFYGLLCLLPKEAKEAIISQLYIQLMRWQANPDGLNQEFVQSVLKWANIWDEYREKHGDGDPLMGRHRKDDPETIEKMKKGYSA